MFLTTLLNAGDGWALTSMLLAALSKDVTGCEVLKSAFLTNLDVNGCATKSMFLETLSTDATGWLMFLATLTNDVTGCSSKLTFPTTLDVDGCALWSTFQVTLLKGVDGWTATSTLLETLSNPVTGSTLFSTKYLLGSSSDKAIASTDTIDKQKIRPQALRHPKLS